MRCDYVLRKGWSGEGAVSLRPRVPVLPQSGWEVSLRPRVLFFHRRMSRWLSHTHCKTTNHGPTLTVLVSRGCERVAGTNHQLPEERVWFLGRASLFCPCLGETNFLFPWSPSMLAITQLSLFKEITRSHFLTCFPLLGGGPCGTTYIGC